VDSPSSKERRAIAVRPVEVKVDGGRNKRAIWACEHFEYLQK